MLPLRGRQAPAFASAAPQRRRPINACHQPMATNASREARAGADPIFMGIPCAPASGGAAACSVPYFGLGAGPACVLKSFSEKKAMRLAPMAREQRAFTLVELLVAPPSSAS